METWLTHDPAMGSDKSCVDSKVSWRARVRLDINTPIVWAQTKCCQTSLLAQQFHLINEFIATIVPVKKWIIMNIYLQYEHYWIYFSEDNISDMVLYHYFKQMYSQKRLYWYSLNINTCIVKNINHTFVLPFPQNIY